MAWHIRDHSDPHGEHSCWPTYDTEAEALAEIAHWQALAVANDWPWPWLDAIEGPPPLPPVPMGDEIGEHVYGGGWLFPDR